MATLSHQIATWLLREALAYERGYYNWF